MTKTWENLQAGDKLQRNNETLELVAVVQKVIAYVHGDYVVWRLMDKLKIEGYTIVQPEPETIYEPTTGMNITIKQMGELRGSAGGWSSFGTADNVGPTGLHLTGATNFSEGLVKSSDGLDIIVNPERWKPEPGEAYYVIEMDLDVAQFNNDGGSLDNRYFEVGNCFPDKASATIAAERTRALWLSLK